MTHSVRLLSIGTATPGGSFSQSDAALHAGAIARNGSVPDDSRQSRRASAALRVLYERSGVCSRGTVLSDAGHDLESFFPTAGSPGPSTAARMEIYAAHAGRLAIDAALAAVRKSGTNAGAITHLVTASCTGFDAPGVDQQIIRELGLPPSVRRTHIGFMGCHAAINALAVAAAFAAQDSSAQVLVVCVELCSLHFSYAEDSECRVANALFADGAGAALIGATVSDEPSEASGSPIASPPPRIAAFASTLFEGTEGLMGWRIGDHGFEMNLSPRVPDVLAARVPAWLDGVLASQGLDRDAVASWAIHPGGPRLLSAITDAMELPEGADAVSREILASHGNMSSATVLFILERVLAGRAGGGDRLPLLAAAFGPGLAGEAMLLI